MKSKTGILAFASTLATAALAATAISVVGVSSGCEDEETCDLDFVKATVDEGVCALTAGSFSTTIDNEFFPLVPGTVTVLEGAEDGEVIEVVITVTNDTENVGGVTTRVVTEEETVNGVLVEVSRNFYAQASDGTVCYFGEDVDNYVGGIVDNHAGQWRAGEGDNRPGIIMPANPQAGDIYIQEIAPGVAQDMARVTALGETLATPAGTYTDTVTGQDCDTLDRDEFETKVYVSGIGLAYDDGIVLSSVSD